MAKEVLGLSLRIVNKEPLRLAAVLEALSDAGNELCECARRHVCDPDDCYSKALAKWDAASQQVIEFADSDWCKVKEVSADER